MAEIARQLPIVPRVVPLLPCLPPVVRRRLSGQPVGSERMPVLSLPAEVGRYVRTPAPLRVSEHAARHRVVADGAHEGPWRHEFAPHTVKIMDTFGLPHVREVWFCGVEQSGKTNTMLNCLLWTIEHSPGNVFYLMPSEDTSLKITAGKIAPMLARSPHMRGYLSDRKDDTTMKAICLRNGVQIWPAHANSATSMATWAAKHCFGDEVDKYPPMAGKETDPITLISKRNRTYRGRYKRFFASTPAGRFIADGVANCHQVWAYRARCPHCGELVRMDALHLVLPDKATPTEVELHGCSYACNSCGVEWNEEHRLRAIRSGCWAPIKGGEVGKPARVGFHHRAWDCLDISLKEIAVAWLRGQQGDMAAKVAWANGYEAEDYQHAQQDRKEDQILRLVDPSMPRGVVPPDTACLLLLVDTQKYGFRYQVWAVGYGEQPVIAVIDRSFVHKFADLENLAAKEWHDASGVGYRILAGWIDSGGGTDPHHPKHSRTQAVYLFCKRNPLFNPIKGRRDQAQPWNLSRIEYLPSRNGKKVPIAGGLNLYTLNVTLYKGELATALEVEMGDPGSLRLHAGLSMDYARQMCAEYQDERGYWQCPRGKDNHDWDISVYGFAAIDIMAVRNWRRDAAKPQPITPAPQARRRRW